MNGWMAAGVIAAWLGIMFAAAVASAKDRPFRYGYQPKPKGDDR